MLYTNQPFDKDLLLHLNARRDDSYGGTGNVWKDISGNNYHGYGDPNSSGSGTNDSQFPIYHENGGGVFEFDGSKGITITDTIPNPSNWITIECWLYRSTNNNTEYISDARNGNGTWHLTNYSGHNINFSNSLQADNPSSHQSNSDWWKQWIHLVAMSDGSNSELYINGSQITGSKLKSSGGFDTGLGQYFRIGNRFTSSGRMTGFFSTYRIYDRKLTPRQIEQNYNAEKKYHQYNP